MYNYRYRRFGWMPVLILLFVVFVLFSGGFHRPWFFFGPLFFCFPFLLAGGIAMLFAARWRYSQWPKQKRRYYHDEMAREDNDSDIFYV
jgi:hypothetical protein